MKNALKMTVSAIGFALVATAVSAQTAPQVPLVHGNAAPKAAAPARGVQAAADCLAKEVGLVQAKATDSQGVEREVYGGEAHFGVVTVTTGRLGAPHLQLAMHPALRTKTYKGVDYAKYAGCLRLVNFVGHR